MKFIMAVLLSLIATTANAALNPELSAWLDSHPNVKEKMKWGACPLTRENTTQCAKKYDAQACNCFNSVQRVTYDNWPNEMKELLHSAYQQRVSGQFMAVQDPPQAYTLLRGDFVSRRAARSLYIAHLAQTFWWELHGGHWSFETLNNDALDVLFNGLYMFGAEDTGGYARQGDAWNDPTLKLPYRYPVTPGDPAYSYQYLVQRNLIGNTPRETIVRVLNWARTQGIHATGGLSSTGNRRAQWQYDGAPPVTRILHGTRMLDMPGSTIGTDDRQISRIPGCHGFTGLLNWLLRTVNIPVSALYPDLDKTGHSLTYFVSEDLFLSHGDDYKLEFPGGLPKETTDPISGALVFGSPDDYDMNCLFIDRNTHCLL